MRRLPLLTTSAAKLYRSCQRRYQLEIERGYKSATSTDALHFGTLFHLGLEAWWTAARDAAPVDAWLSASLAAVSTELDPFTRVKTEAHLFAYHHRWSAMEWRGHPIRVLAVEREFTAPLLNPATGAESRTWQRAGKIDAIVEAGGLVYTIEHKTSGEDIAAGSPYWQRLMLDPQVSNYHVGARALGFEPAACLYDVTGKTDLKPYRAKAPEDVKWTKGSKNVASRPCKGQHLTDETPEEYGQRILDTIAENPDAFFVRGDILRSPEDESEAAADTWQTGLQIQSSRRLNLWPRNPDACQKYGTTCPFFQVCTGTASLDDYGRFRRASLAHEELSQAVQAA